MKIFDMESPVMQALGKMADLLWLNILTLVCCIPVVTAGAALTALNYMALKIVRDEECYVTKDYFKSFKRNFKQATIIWFLLLFAVLFLAYDCYLLRNLEETARWVVGIGLAMVVVLLYFTAIYVFAVLAKFDNTVFGTIKNAFLISIMRFPRTVLMAVCYLAPVVLFIYFYSVSPLMILFGLSLPAWVSALLYNKFFKKLEEQVTAASGSGNENEDEDEHIFHDETDEHLSGGVSSQ